MLEYWNKTENNRQCTRIKWPLLKIMLLMKAVVMTLFPLIIAHSHNLISVVRDGDSNCAAMRTVHIVYPKLIDITCFSHMLNCV